MPTALTTASGARFIVEVVLDLDPLQMLRQLLPTVLVAILNAPSDKLFARLIFDTCLIELVTVNALSKQ